MESNRELDASGDATIAINIRRVGALVLILLLWISRGASGQQPSDTGIKTLFENGQWAEIVARVRGPSPNDADLNYYYGIAAAQLGRFDEARAALLTGARLRPKDPRFPIELGGVAFRQKRYSDAARWIQKGLDLNPQDAYANEFLATIYFINSNLDAALKYWNHIGKPQIQSIQTPPLKVKPALVDRAIAFSPASVLTLPDLLTTRARLDGLGIFPEHSFRLILRPDGKFDALLMTNQRNGMGGDTLQALGSMFQGVLYDTIYPVYFNIGRSAINFTSLVRWDSEKRRVFASISSPLRSNPKYRLQIVSDLRNENWEIRVPPTVQGNLQGAMNMRRQAMGAQFTSFSSGRWSWSTGAELSHRDYRNIVDGSIPFRQRLAEGYGLKYVAKTDYEFLFIPENRFSSSAMFSLQAGSVGSGPSHTFEKLESGVRGNWYPKLAGDDYFTQAQIRAGKAFGQVPFDELNVLGLERDTDLLMRAHLGANKGVKGSAPIGRDYFLTNIETDKNIYQTALIRAALSPFLDVGKVTDPAPELGSKKWLFDTGMQLKIRVWGIGLLLTYGKDLRTGRNAIFFTAGK